MKKIFFICACTLALFTSCRETDTKKYNEEWAPSVLGEVTGVDVLPSVQYNGYNPTSIIKFKYDGHSYICFKPNDNYANCSIVHDPDCPCGGSTTSTTSSNDWSW